MRLKKYYIEQFLERHKIARYIYMAIMTVIGVLFVVGVFSWDSLLGWIITKEKSELHAFIFWAVFAVVLIVAAIVITIIIGRKKK
jgi:uncharacterized membrane protein